MNDRNFRIIDLSSPLDNDVKEPMPPKIEYMKHEEGAVQAANLLGLEPSDFPESKAWANEQVTLTTHTGTHVDAPWHYWPTSEGERARTIDEMPLEWFYGNGVLFDLVINQKDMRFKQRIYKKIRRDELRASTL